MISYVSIGLAAYQAMALLTGRRRVSTLAHTWPWAVAIWGWWAWLGIHFLDVWLNEEIVRKRVM